MVIIVNSKSRTTFGFAVVEGLVNRGRDRRNSGLWGVLKIYRVIFFMNEMVQLPGNLT